MIKSRLIGGLVFIFLVSPPFGIKAQWQKNNFDPSYTLWYKNPANKWEEALPVGNGRLGAMVFGGYREERIQINEETCWTGGPYSTTVKGGYKVLPEIQDALFKGDPIAAHRLFGRHLMGYPVEQQKYQSLGNIILFFNEQKEVKDYVRWLDLKTGITHVRYSVEGVTYFREAFVSAPDQVIVVNLKCSEPGKINLRAQLRGVRNSAHSNYATDYFQMDSEGDDGLTVKGKSADYMGIEGRLKYRVQLRAVTLGGTLETDNIDLVISDANEATLYITAATNFINYKDVSGDQDRRVEEYLSRIKDKSYDEVRDEAVKDYRKLFDRVELDLPKTENSYLPTDERMADFENSDDPNLASLAYHFGRYVLISSSRAGTQAANLQGIWNDDMNPAWDSKYTTNINLEMNYWPVESGNLSECAEPFVNLVKELTDQGAEVAREHYGAGGWVFHQNTDLWRVAAPMDGPTWGTFTVGGAWLVTQLYDQYLYSREEKFLRDIFPILKGSVQFFLDFLIEHPNGKWLVTSPSTSPENPPEGPGYKYFYDEVTGSYYFTTICYGSSIDMQILSDLFTDYLETCETLNLNEEMTEKVRIAKSRLVPPQIGPDGALQEWTEAYGQMEPNHRHSSHMYGLYPGNVISIRKTPELVPACEKVLNQRGDGASGWSRGWKMALWARLGDGNRSLNVFKGYIKEQAYPQLFARCGTPLQIDGTMGVTAGITEMLMQSNEGAINLLPALPASWGSGSFSGVCAREGFELSFKWSDSKVTKLEILSKSGRECKIFSVGPLIVYHNGKKIKIKKPADGIVAFPTTAGERYFVIYPSPNPVSDKPADLFSF